MHENDSTLSHTGKPQRLPWTTPAVRDLPHLSELTLQTGGAIDGGIGTGGGGSTVF
jgi:hypothetical protein